MPYSSQGEGAPKYMEDIYEDNSEKSPEEKESKEDERLREFQEKAMELLELYGVVERKEDGFIVVDLKEIKNFSNRLVSGEPTAESYRVYGYEKIKDKINYNEEGPSKGEEERLKDIKKKLKEIGHEYFGYFEGGARHFLLSAFKDREVLTKKEFEEGKTEGKPLFYHPKNKEEAFDKEKIKNADFHMGPWEVNTGATTEVYSSLSEDENQSLDFTEVSLAALVYNKSYGDGERKDGNLMARSVDSKTGEYSDTNRKKISRDWVTKDNKFYGANFRETRFKSSPREALEEGHYENLQENGLLKPEDFEAIGTSEVFKKFGVYSKIQQEKGLVMIDGNRYSLGSEYADGNHWVASLGENKFAILKSETKDSNPDEIVATFDKNETKSGYIGKKEMKENLNLSTYEDGVDEVFLKRKPEESKEEYQKRLEQELLDFSELLELKKEVARKTDVSLEKLKPEQQHAFLRFYKKKKENDPENLDEVYDFVNTYEDVGLKSFDSLQYSNFSGDDLIEIGKKPETPADAVSVFRKYNEVMAKVSNLGKEISSFFKKEQHQDIDKKQLSFEIADRASKILTKGLEESEDETYEQIKENLEEIEEDIVTFTSIFKTAFKGKKEVDFEQVKGLDFESLKPDELSEHQKDELLEIVRANYGDKENVGDNIIGFAKETLSEENKDHDIFILSRKNEEDEEEMMSFIYFSEPYSKESDQKNHRWVGLLNVSPEYKSSAIGESMLRKTLSDQSEDYILDAGVFLDDPLSVKDVEEFGFNITGTSSEHMESESDWYFSIQIDEDTNRGLETKNTKEFSRQKLIREYEENFSELDLENIGDISKDYVVLKFNPQQERQEIREVTEELTEESEYIGTRHFLGPSSETNEHYFVFEQKP